MRCVSWHTRGHFGYTASSQRSKEQKHIYFTRPARNNDIICLQQTHGKYEFVQAVQVLHTQFRLFGTFTLNNVNAVGSAVVIHKNLLPDGSIASHLTTCQGRDHIVPIRSGKSVLVVVGVHFELDLVLRDLRERRRRISDHWPRYPEAFVIIGDLNICEFEEGSFKVRNQTFTEGDAVKTGLFRSYFPRVFEIAQLNFTRKDSSADGAPRTPSRIDRAFINVPVAEARDFHCTSHVSDNLGERSIPSDDVAGRIVVQKTTNRCDQVKRIPSWMSKHPVSALLKRISDGQYFDEPLAALADFKVIIEKGRKQTHQELLRNTSCSLGAKLLTASTALRAYRRMLRPMFLRVP